MLEHVVETQILYFVFGSVNVFIPVRLIRLNHEGGRIPGL